VGRFGVGERLFRRVYFELISTDYLSIISVLSNILYILTAHKLMIFQVRRKIFYANSETMKTTYIDLVQTT
jgi:hypothetical protein